MALTNEGNIIRRSVYQNSNTLVEVLIKSKEPRPRAGGQRPAAAAEPAWPPAVPVRKDGRPLSAPAPLPSRPRSGRQLPTWRPTVERDGGAAGRGGQRAPPAPSGQRAPPVPRGQRAPPAPRVQRAPLPPPGQQALSRSGPRPAVPSAPRPPRPQPPPQPAEARAAAGPFPERSPRAAEAHDHATQEFRTWAKNLSKLVQDIKKRPAIAHLRPLLTRLEETVREPPAPFTYTDPGEDDLLRQRLEEIQEENEELQRKFQTLSSTMREYQRTFQSQPQPQPRPAGGGDGDTELAELRRQLAKYKKYAKELKKTKENLLASIQTMEESHAAELKELRAEHEAQMSQVLAQVTSETEILGSFRADAEAVQRSLAQRVQENAELRQLLAERDAQLERLAALNRSLQEVARKQLQQLAGAELPAVGQLTSKLQSPPSAGAPGPDGAGDGGGDRAPADWGGRAVSLASLDVTEPLPARPFPGEWPDVSLSSAVGSAPPPAAGGPPPQEPPGGGGDEPALGPDGAGERGDDGGTEPAGGGGDNGASSVAGRGQPLSEQEFLRSLARLSQQLTGLQEGVSRAGKVLTP